MERQEITYDNQILSCWDEYSIPEIIAALSVELGKLPVERHGEKVVTAEDNSGGVYVHYRRLETDSEMAERELREAKYAAENEARERNEFQRLMKKYGAEPGP